MAIAVTLYCQRVSHEPVHGTPRSEGAPGYAIKGRVLVEMCYTGQKKYSPTVVHVDVWLIWGNTRKGLLLAAHEHYHCSSRGPPNEFAK